MLLCMERFLQAPHFCDQKVDKPMEEQGVLGEVCVPCLRSSVSCHQNDMANEPNGSGQSITDWNGVRDFMASLLAFAFDWFCLTHPVLFYAVSVLPTLCYLMWGICPTHPGLFYVENVSDTPIPFCVRSMSYTPSAILCGEFLFYVGSFVNAPCCFKWGASCTHPMLLYVWIFCYTPCCFK